MELLQSKNGSNVSHQNPIVLGSGVEQSTTKPFIEANTIEMNLNEMATNHIIPVFSANNDPLISHNDFIDKVYETVSNRFKHLKVLAPSIRVSHPIKGRIPEARNKPASELADWEQTLYYERMMFVIEIPQVKIEIGGNNLSLTVGGVKSYNMDNLYGKRPSGDQHFQLFIGFQNQVCSNLCISTDGLMESICVQSIDQLEVELLRFINVYNMRQDMDQLYKLNERYLTESEFAQFIGRSRMYKYISNELKESIQEMKFGDQQLGVVVKDFHTDENFCHDDSGGISLWRFYNLLTGVNKSTYIDRFLERSVNAMDLANEVLDHKLKRKESWYLG